MTTEHKHAALLRAIADGNDIEFVWRIKAKTIRIGEYDVPEPMRVAPKEGTTYYFAELAPGTFADWYVWENDEQDAKLLAMGICHLTEDAAVMHAKALLSLTKA